MNERMNENKTGAHKQINTWPPNTKTSAPEVRFAFALPPTYHCAVSSRNGIVSVRSPDGVGAGSRPPRMLICNEGCNIFGSLS